MLVNILYNMITFAQINEYVEIVIFDARYTKNLIF